ncbi:MAG TPA: YdeI/OmpD-associated family protein [Solirubrobacteraceae bacterium]|nr:YdeI/OmpD-associated family protein [Solirubrobacteraceae bacterium]
MRFRACLQLDGKTATGIVVPDEVVAALDGGNRPRVRVTLAGFSYASTVGRMRGEFKLPVSAAVREQTGLAAGDEVEVELALDTAPRELDVPADLATALSADQVANDAFSKLSYSARKRHVLSVAGAKTPETRQRRVAKVLTELH